MKKHTLFLLLLAPFSLCCQAIWTVHTVVANSGAYSQSGSIGTGGTANQFILQAGTYIFEAFCPAQQINVHLAKLVNVTDNQDVLIGSAGYSPVNVHAVSPSIIMGQFTIASPKTFAILHRGGSSRPNGFGVSHWWGDNVFTQVKILKVN